jgi:hypothetical protein
MGRRKPDIQGYFTPKAHGRVPTTPPGAVARRGADSIPDPTPLPSARPKRRTQTEHPAARYAAEPPTRPRSVRRAPGPARPAVGAPDLRPTRAPRGLVPERQAGPRPLLRPSHQAGTQGIALDVAQDGQPVVILLDGEGPKPPLPDVAAPPVALAVAVPRGGQQPLHPRAQLLIGAGPQDRVKMIRQQTKGHQPHGQACTGLPEDPDKAVVIVGVVENPGPAIAPVQGMGTISAEVSAGRTRHAGIVSPIGGHRKLFSPESLHVPSFSFSHIFRVFCKTILNVPVSTPVSTRVEGDKWKEQDRAARRGWGWAVEWPQVWGPRPGQSAPPSGRDFRK